MGCDATAQIVFGIGLGEGEGLPEGLIFDFEDFILEKETGIKPPSVDYSEASKKEYEDFWDKSKNFFETFVADLFSYGALDACPQYVIGIKSSCVQADWDCAMKLEKFPSVSQDDIKKFKEFCQKYDIQGEPSWLLLASYG